MSTEALAPALARPAARRRAPGFVTDRALPVAAVSLVILLLWYLGAIVMNADLQRDAFANAGTTTYTTADLIAGTWNQERPRLPAPHQIVAELDRSLLRTPLTSKRSLAYHAAVTVEATALGFVLGAGLGLGLGVLVVHSRSLDRGMMPWIVASQTVPVVALAPMIVVILNQFDVTGLVPKAAIAAYLSFFPVTVGMVKGLRSPDPLQRDLMRTYSASRAQTLSKLRLPASLPFFFASLKIGVAASLVGTIVAEVTKSEDGGLGARLLAGSYYGQTVQIWAALITAAICAAVLVGLVGVAERLTTRALGGRA
jgi:NitT/TauT family transport system permease protein